MIHPKIASHEKILGKACVVEVLGLGYFRVISETGRGDLICGQPGQQVSAGDIGWVIGYPGSFYGGLRFVQGTSLVFDFEQAKKLYSHVWKSTWPGYTPTPKKQKENIDSEESSASVTKMEPEPALECASESLEEVV